MTTSLVAGRCKMLTPQQHEALKKKLVDTFSGAAVEVLQVRDADELKALQSSADAKRAHLTDVAITMAAAAIAEQWAKDAATAAAGMGASYTELGTAAGITRQGARSRWPGLAELATAARRAGRPPAPKATQRDTGRTFNGGADTVEIEYEHTVTAWTVGDLRQALQPVPADMPLHAVTAEKAGGDIEGETQVVTSTFFSESGLKVDAGKQRFTLLLDFPSGTYNRHVPGLYGRATMGEPFTHEVQPITAAAVLAAMDGLPDDMPVDVWPADDPGSNTGETQVVYDAAIGLDWSPPARGEREGEWVTGNHFDLQLEYPSGRYLRWVDSHLHDQ